MPGMFRSHTIRSGSISAATLTPVCPSAAGTASKPCLARNLRMTWRKLSSSSMTRILLTALSGTFFTAPPRWPQPRHLEAAVKKNPDTAVSKILVIDDEESFRQVILKFLAKQGFEAVPAADGQTGVRVAAEMLPDLIVCDLNMPGMDGYEVLATLRRDPKLADIPLIFLTGQSQPSQVRQGMSLGADDYLTKPVNPVDLISAIKARLGRRQAQRQRQEKQMERAMQLFGGIVHDLRDPLFVVLGYTDILRGGAGKAPSTGENSTQILDRMHQAVLQMQAVISETLFLARSRMQRLPFDPSPHLEHRLKQGLRDNRLH